MYFLDILHQIKRSLRHLNLQTPDSRFKIQEDPMSKTAPEPDKKDFDEMPQDLLKHILSFLSLSQNLTVISKRILDCLNATQHLKFSRFKQVFKIDSLGTVGRPGPWIQEVSSESVLYPLQFVDLPHELCFEGDILPTAFMNELKADVWFKMHNKEWTSQFRRCDLWTGGHGWTDRKYRTGWMKIDAASPETPDQILRDRWIVPEWAKTQLLRIFFPKFFPIKNSRREVMYRQSLREWKEHMAFLRWQKEAIERAADYD